MEVKFRSPCAGYGSLKGFHDFISLNHSFNSLGFHLMMTTPHFSDPAQYIMWIFVREKSVNFEHF